MKRKVKFSVESLEVLKALGIDFKYKYGDSFIHFEGLTKADLKALHELIESTTQADKG